MKSLKSPVLPSVAKVLAILGKNIKLVRLRRKLSSEQVAQGSNISRPTLLSIEKGLPSVAMGS